VQIFHESTIVLVVKELLTLRVGRSIRQVRGQVIYYMPVSNHEVLPAVQIIIETLQAKAKIL
jgi:hypothetical protein